MHNTHRSKNTTKQPSYHKIPIMHSHNTTSNSLNKNMKSYTCTIETINTNNKITNRNTQHKISTEFAHKHQSKPT